MPLQDASLTIAATYTLAAPVTGFDDREQSGSISAGGAVDTDEWDQVYSEQFALTTTAPSADIDLYSFVNTVCESVTGARVLGGAIQISSDGTVEVKPGAITPFQWFFTSLTEGVRLTGNSNLAIQDESFDALSAGSRLLSFELVAGSEATVTVIIYISTTA